jgi:hypothetical protein
MQDNCCIHQHAGNLTAISAFFDETYTWPVLLLLPHVNLHNGGVGAAYQAVRSTLDGFRLPIGHFHGKSQIDELL